MTTYFLAKYRNSPTLTGLEIARRLGITVITPKTMLRWVRPHDVVINWGRVVVLPPELAEEVVWRNKPEAISVCGHKLRTLARLQEAKVPTLEYTTDPAVAAEWGDRAYARHLLRASSGRGVEVVEPGSPIPQAPLYTRAFPTREEYRVHVMSGSGAFFVQKKMRMRQERRPPNYTPLVRSHGNGWVFAHKEVNVPVGVAAIAGSAVVACGLTFGAVDILFDGERAVVCEVNSTPGVGGTTVDKYVEAFRKFHI